MYSSLKLAASRKACSNALLSAGLRPGCADRAGDARQFFLDLVQVGFKPLGGHTDLFKHGGDHALAVFDERQQQVDGLQFGVAELGRVRLRLLHRLLRFHREFVPMDGHENSSCQ